MPGIPLPSPDNLFANDEFARMAYQRIYPLENQQQTMIRLLGRMLIHAPTEGGRTHIAQAINSAATDQSILELGQYYLKYFVNFFKRTTNNATPASSSHPSRPSVDTLRDQILNSIIEAPTNHSTAKTHALIRDNYRCMLSGAVDFQSYQGSQRLQAELGDNPPVEVLPTECSHILPQYISHNIQDNAEKRFNSATIWSVLQCFGGVAPEETNAAGMHHLRNIMTMQTNIHKQFDMLTIWLDPVDGQEHTYTLGRSHPVLFRGLPETITFTSSSPAFELPDRRYLALHAACAKVIHMSGAAEEIDTILRNMESTRVLSQDGSSAELLDYFMWEDSLMVS